MTEVEIYEGCRSGDDAARKELYVRYAGKLLAIGMRYLADKESAEDTLHDVFVKVYGSFGKFKYLGSGSLQAWLTRVMVNECVGKLRGNRLLATIPADNVADDLPEPDSVKEVPARVLMRMIGELPAGYRAVFNLFVFEKKSHKEIAEMLGVSEKTSSSQFLRARKALSRKIYEYLDK